MLRLQARHHFGLDGLAGIGFDVKNLAAVAHFGKGNCQAIAPGAARAANAVGVILGLHRQAEVKHVGNGGHVNTARSHVGSDQNLHMALAQRHQAAVAQTLAQGAVQGHGVKAVLLQVVGQAVALDLRAGKNDGLVDTGVTQPVVQQLALVLGVVGPKQHLLDVGVLFLRAVDGDALGFAHHTGSELLNARRKGSAKHHGLLAVNGQLVDLGQIVRETQVQHAVGFVHHQELHLVELDLHRTLQVQQTAGRCNHQIGVLQLGDLQLVRHATHDVGNAQATAMLHQVNRVVRDLLGEFAGGANDQGAGCGCLEVARVGWVFALGALGGGFAFGSGVGHGFFVFQALGFFGVGGLLEQGVQHRQQEGCGLAASGLAGNHQVNVGGGFCAGGSRWQGQRNHLHLHGGGLGVTQVFTSLHQLRGQGEFDKAVGQFGLLHGVHEDFGRRHFHVSGFDGKVFNRREFARYFKSISHFFLTRERHPAGGRSVNG